LSKVTGRQLDVLQTPDGRRVPGEFFPHLMKDFPAIRRFQVVQEEPDRIQIRLVLGPGWSEDNRQTIEAAVQEVFGAQGRIELEPVESIPVTGAGKLRVVVNRCVAPAWTAVAAH